MVFDINGLKEVNDTLGHEAGDKMITACAQVISRVFGDEAIYRVGGDEFAAIICGKQLETFMELLDSLKNRLH